MKKTIITIILIVSCLPIFAIDIEASASTDNYAFKIDGTINEKKPDFGFNVEIREHVNNFLEGSLGITRVPGLGNTIWGRMTYQTNYMNVSIGTTLGFLNNDRSKKDFLTLFQPGIGTALSFKTPIGLTTSIETNFALPLVRVKKRTIYLQNGIFQVGWIFPNIRAEFKLSQNNKTAINDDAETYISITDIGFHTVSYSKPSRLRIPLNVIYRISRYQKIDTNEVNDGFSSVIIEAGVIHSITTDFEWFARFGASVYSFDMATKNTIKKFFFQANAGVSVTINKK